MGEERTAQSRVVRQEVGLPAGTAVGTWLLSLWTAEWLTVTMRRLIKEGIDAAGFVAWLAGPLQRSAG